MACQEKLLEMLETIYRRSVTSEIGRDFVYSCFVRFYFTEHVCIGFLFEQEGIQGNDWAKDYAIFVKKNSFNLADMESNRNLFWKQVANL